MLSRLSPPFIFSSAIGLISLLIIALFPVKGIALVLLLATMAVGLLILWGYHKMSWFPFLILGATILGQLGRYQFSEDASSALLVIDWLTVLYAGLGALFVLLTGRRMRWSASYALLLLFVAWMALSLLLGSTMLSSNELTIAGLYAARFVAMVASIGITAALLTRPQDESQLWKALIATGLVLAVLGFIQLVLFPNFAFMARYGWDPHEGRLLSTFFDPNFFGMFLVMILSLILGAFFLLPQKRLTLGLISLPLVAALILTFSRSSYLAFLISLLIILTIRSWRLVFITLLVLFAVGASIPRVRNRVTGALTVDTTAQDRIQSWQETFVIIRARPWAGVGYNAFGPAQIQYNLKKNLTGRSSHGSDSSLLLTFATTGLVGLVLYLLFWLATWYEALLAYRFHSSPLTQSLGLALLGLIPAYLVHSQFVNGLYYPLLFVPFGLLLALLYYGLRSLPAPRLED